MGLVFKVWMLSGGFKCCAFYLLFGLIWVVYVCCVDLLCCLDFKLCCLFDCFGYFGVRIVGLLWMLFV